MTPAITALLAHLDREPDRAWSPNGITLTHREWAAALREVTPPLVVTDAMVDAAFTEARQFCGFNPWPDDDLRETMRDVLTAALAATTEADA